jgi:hypothetical protein
MQKTKRKQRKVEKRGGEVGKKIQKKKKKEKCTVDYCCNPQ